MDPQRPASTLPGIHDPRDCNRGITGRVRPPPPKDDPDRTGAGARSETEPQGAERDLRLTQKVYPKVIAAGQAERPEAQWSRMHERKSRTRKKSPYEDPKELPLGT
ncbi:hypothetical protein [Desulfotruncus alcoholivorax]|uniref:hypothetical protein n=1 Tax=Desulfotruncus alcoholivorax TaxID=265477 RepID=UPI00040293E5|nr:hypothetical protein [Desulfotruncus alcoholivorax]